MRPGCTGLIIIRIDKGCTTNLNGWKTDQGKIEALLRFDEHYVLKLEPKKNSTTQKVNNKNTSVKCPKCKKGNLLKGKSAYGCSNYKKGCSFTYTFEDIKTKAKGKPLTKELVYKIISE